MDKITEFLKNAFNRSWYAGVIAIIVVLGYLLLTSGLLTSCATTHAVSQSFVQRGDTMVMIRYEQVGQFKK